MLPEEIIAMIWLIMILGGFTAYGSFHVARKLNLFEYDWNPWTKKNFLTRFILIDGYILLHQIIMLVLFLGVPFPALVIEILWNATPIFLMISIFLFVFVYPFILCVT